MSAQAQTDVKYVYDKDLQEVLTRYQLTPAARDHAPRREARRALG